MGNVEKALENIIVYPLKNECENSPCCECNKQCDFFKMKEEDYDILSKTINQLLQAAVEFAENLSHYGCPGELEDGEPIINWGKCSKCGVLKGQQQECWKEYFLNEK